MALTLSMAEAMNLGWSEVAGTGKGSIEEKLADRRFRIEVIDRLALEREGLRTSKARRVMKSREFIAWMRDPQATGLVDHLTDEQLRSFGVDDTETAELVGQAIGRAISAVVFEQADWVHRELLRRNTSLDERGVIQINLLQDIWDLLTNQGMSAPPSASETPILELRQLQADLALLQPPDLTESPDAMDLFMRGERLEAARRLGDLSEEGYRTAAVLIEGKSHLLRPEVIDRLRKQGALIKSETMDMLAAGQSFVGANPALASMKLHYCRMALRAVQVELGERQGYPVTGVRWLEYRLWFDTPAQA